MYYHSVDVKHVLKHSKYLFDMFNNLFIFFNNNCGDKDHLSKCISASIMCITTVIQLQSNL